jgi:hypothetical protein
VSYFNPHNT